MKSSNEQGSGPGTHGPAYLSIGASSVETAYLVSPEHVNLIGTLHGGFLMDWMIATASIAAARLARGSFTLASVDRLFFLNPVRAGELVMLRARVEHVGRSSMEVGLEAFAENLVTGERRRTTLAHMAFVALNKANRPREVPVKIRPAPGEEGLYEEARKRRERRLDWLREGPRQEEVEEGHPWRLTVTRLVMPEDAIYGNIMYAGRLLKLLDDVGAALAIRYARGPVVTASLDDTHFYEPVLVGDLLEVSAALNYVGRSSMEIGVRVVAEDPAMGEKRHVTTSYLTYVHVKAPGEAAPLPPYVPQTPEAERRWREAEGRRQERLRELERLKASFGDRGPR
jgi:acyl-CoA hydrolase